MIKAVVLVSGGIDSTTCLALAKRNLAASEVAALSINYGQKHVREIEAAKEICRFYNVAHEEISIPRYFEGAGSTLIDSDRETPNTTYEGLAKMRGISPTYVPFRNGNLISIATAYALTLLTEDQRERSTEPVELFYGAHAEDARNWAYPDCTPEFNGAMANAVFIGSYQRVRLVTPLQHMEKWEIVHRAQLLLAPLNMTYSCYNGREKHCGTCPTCVARQAAFSRAAVHDLTQYEQRAQ